MFSQWNHPDLSSWTQNRDDMTDFTRQAGLNELGFYNYANSDIKAPSDTFIRLSCRHQPGLDLSEARISHAWCILRTRHPLLDCHFTHSPLTFHWICNDNLERARRSILHRPMFSNWDDERNDITNGSRIISDTQLSQLRIYKDPNSANIEIVLICSHAISDALSLATCMRDFMAILGSPRPLKSFEGSIDTVVKRLPIALEGSLPHRERTLKTLWQAAIMYTIFQGRVARKAKTAPGFNWRDKHPETRQVVYEFPAATTNALIQACRRQGCTVGHLIYAASNAAFSEIVRPPPGSMTFIGTPANARRGCREPYRSKRDDMMVSLTFLDIYLPSIQIPDHSPHHLAKLWYMARMAKKQVHAQVLDPDAAIWTYINQELRYTRNAELADNPPEPTGEPATNTMSYASSAIGSLDHLLHIAADNPIQVEDMSIGMRVRKGETLMHSYSFHGKLRLSLMYDHQLGIDPMRRWLSLTAELMEAVLSQSNL